MSIEPVSIESVYQRIVGALPDLLPLIINTRICSAPPMDFWVWDRLSEEEDCTRMDLRRVAEWDGDWLRLYTTRLALMAKMRATCPLFRQLIDTFFLVQAWFTHPTQIRAFLRAYPPGHPLLSTVRSLRVDLALASNLPWKDIPYTASSWPRHRTHDIYWHPPPDMRSAHYGVVEVMRLYRMLFNRTQHIVSFDNGIHASLGLFAHPPPPGYLRTLLHAQYGHLKSLRIISPVFNSDLITVIGRLHHLEELVIHFLAERYSGGIPDFPANFSFPKLRKLHVAGQIQAETLIFVRRWTLPMLEVFSSAPTIVEPYLLESLQKFGKNLHRLVIQGKYSLTEALPLVYLCPAFEALEITFTEFPPPILSHPSIRTIVIHCCDLLSPLTVNMERFRAQMDVLVEMHSLWPRLTRVIDTSGPPRPFNYDHAGYLTWWDSPLRLCQLWQVGFTVLSAHGDEMRGELEHELQLLME
ncbi:hypothetical protein M422DRAFT_267732 [Sphaerobolus stellatus SS14]|uniref:F-box domain-containing protein n=1 Tax=Sphaerobolus stellatus (strain SS14) TaxID=990650 RepID=A0A0C9UZ44_SPHS4|nr:hypothetical protein M422DRAFT_267732 [Sphaerobolus stellatus SS14]